VVALVDTRWSDDGFARVTMARPERRNALSGAMIDALAEAVEQVAASDARGMVLTGQGPVFSAGHDFGDMVDRDLDGMTDLLERCAGLMQRLGTIPQPVLARVQGPATAAGCQLVASCDLAVAVDTAWFAAPGGRGGWFCHTPMVAIGRAVPRKQAYELALTGDPIDAETALRWGLINRVVPGAELDVACDALLARATGGSPRSKALGKATLGAQLELDTANAYAFATEVMAASSQSPDGRENLAAFVEKRPASYGP
jgi:enoyl-CoA hydratase/carnithine racemase